MTDIDVAYVNDEQVLPADRPCVLQTAGGEAGSRDRTGRKGPGGGATHVPARPPEAEPLLTRAEVATMFRVDPKTVTRWAKAGKLTSIRTLGGHRRYRETEVRALLAGIPQQRSE